MNFHNRRWILNTTIYPVTPADDGLKSGYKLHPIAYGIEAFAPGGHGIVVPLTMVNPDAVNLTAYAVRDGNDLFVTVINKKDPGSAPRDAEVTINVPGAAGKSSAIFLAAPGNDAGERGDHAGQHLEGECAGQAGQSTRYFSRRHQDRVAVTE